MGRGGRKLGHFYHPPDLRKKAFSFSLLSMTLTMVVHMWSLLCLLSCHHALFLESSHHELENTMAIHSGILAWKIPRTEERGGL